MEWILSNMVLLLIFLDAIVVCGYVGKCPYS